MTKIKVDRDACIGCGACQAICPDVFELNDEGFAEVKDEIKELEQLDDETKESAIDAKEGCPTSAIITEEK